MMTRDNARSSAGGALSCPTQRWALTDIVASANGYSAAWRANCWQQVQSAAGGLTDGQSRDIAWDRSYLLCHAKMLTPRGACDPSVRRVGWAFGSSHGGGEKGVRHMALSSAPSFQNVRRAVDRSNVRVPPIGLMFRATPRSRPHKASTGGNYAIQRSIGPGRGSPKRSPRPCGGSFHHRQLA